MCKTCFNLQSVAQHNLITITRIHIYNLIWFFFNPITFKSAFYRVYKRYWEIGGTEIIEKWLKINNIGNTILLTKQEMKEMLFLCRSKINISVTTILSRFLMYRLLSWIHVNNFYKNEKIWKMMCIYIFLNFTNLNIKLIWFVITHFITVWGKKKMSRTFQ